MRGETMDSKKRLAFDIEERSGGVMRLIVSVAGNRTIHRHIKAGRQRVSGAALLAKEGSGAAEPPGRSGGREHFLRRLAKRVLSLRSCEE